MKQTVYIEKKIEEILPEIFTDRKISKLFVVCGASCKELESARQISRLSVEQVWFSDFTPNPNYESVVAGVELFNTSGCNGILAIGGGSSMDVAKCIKLYANMDPKINYLNQEPKENEIPFIAIPTTAGTGSEATRFAVVYYCGEKQSVVHESIIPEYVFLNADVLTGLPIYQKKATVMDAMCHAIESFWSVNSTQESKEYAKEAIGLINENLLAYLSGDKEAAGKMFLAANAAGKAINITQTTAGHAMCYKITSLYGLPHGHAAAICVEKIWPYMIQNTHMCLDARGTEYLNNIFVELAGSFGCKNAKDAADKFGEMLKRMELGAPVLEGEEQLENFVKSVNVTRLKNNPVQLTEDVIRKLYKEILRG